MQILETMILENDFRTWVVAVSVTLLTSIAFYLTKRTLMVRVAPIFKGNQNPYDDWLVDLIDGTQLYFVVCWSLFAGLTLLKTGPGLDRVSWSAVFLVSMVQISIWCNSLIGFWVNHNLKTRAVGDVSSATALGLLSTLVKGLVYGVVLLLTLNHFGVDITALIAGLGVGGIAVALAVQNILGDLFASLTIVLDKPFVLGDLIQVGEQFGYIEHIGLKTTRLRSLTGEELVYPNSNLLQNRLSNYGRMYERRVLFFIHAVRHTPLELVRKIPKIVKSVIDEHPLARFDRANFKGYSTYSLEFENVYWVKDRDYATYMAVNEAIQLDLMQRFKEEKVEIAFPTQRMVLETESSISSV